MDIEFVSSGAAGGTPAAFAALVYEGGEYLSADARTLDVQSGGAVARAIAAAGFNGAKGRSIELIGVQDIAFARLLLVGVGSRPGLDGERIELAAAEAYQALKASGAVSLTIGLSDLPAEYAARASLGARLAGYRFDRYRTKEKPEKKPTITTVRLLVGDVAAAQTAAAPLTALADSVCFTRDLVSEPANVLYPVEFAQRVKALESLGLIVEVLGEAEMGELGMRSLLGVGQGSARESQLVVMRWNGAADSKARPIAFIGKGVCFDSGGISIKPADGMEDMKWDMGGAGVVAGLMRLLAARKAKVNVVGILGLVENMPDGAAQRPGDIVKSLSGQTIEVINTDAEGRLVLADALWYCQDRFKPRFMIDLATLTGAIIIALGNDYAGLFCNNDDLAGKLLAASSASGEPLWRLPLPASYDRQIESLAADMKNTGGRPAGSITAALFLQRFVNGVPWAHIDIASTTWKKPSSSPIIPEGASGYGVRLLNQLVLDNYEA